MLVVFKPAALITPQEMACVKLLCQGHGDKEIARQLHIEYGTVKNHLLNLRRKLKLRNRTELAMQAVARGWN